MDLPGLALQHSNLCPLYDFEEDERFQAFLVMKCLEFEGYQGNTRPYWTLAEYAHVYRQSHGEMTVQGVVKLLTPVASALDYIHGQKLVHRDLKPANFLIRPPQKNLPLDMQIVDMGLAAEIRSSMSRVSRGGADFAGTAPYMSPEQWRGQPLSGKSDQWALATIAYELLAGELPFDCLNETAWMNCALHEPLPESDKTPAETFETLAQARSGDPQERYASCVDFVVNLNNPPRKAVASQVVSERQAREFSEQAEVKVKSKQAMTPRTVGTGEADQLTWESLKRGTFETIEEWQQRIIDHPPLAVANVYLDRNQFDHVNERWQLDIENVLWRPWSDHFRPFHAPLLIDVAIPQAREL